MASEQRDGIQREQGEQCHALRSGLDTGDQQRYVQKGKHDRGPEAGGS